MEEHYGLIEMLLAFSILMIFLIWQLVSVRRAMDRADRSDDPEKPHGVKPLDEA